MTTQQLAKIFKARKVGKGKYMGRCPSHPDRMASLEIKDGRKVGLTIVGCYAGCAQVDVLAAVGLTQKDLFADSTFRPSSKMRQVWRDEERLEKLEHQLGLCIMARSVLPEESRYWKVAEQRIFERIYDLRCTLFPHEKQRREREYEVQRIIAEYGLDDLWDCLPLARLQARMMNERNQCQKV